MFKVVLFLIVVGSTGSSKTNTLPYLDFNGRYFLNDGASTMSVTHSDDDVSTRSWWFDGPGFKQKDFVTICPICQARLVWKLKYVQVPCPDGILGCLVLHYDTAANGVCEGSEKHEFARIRRKRIEKLEVFR